MRRNRQPQLGANTVSGVGFEQRLPVVGWKKTLQLRMNGLKVTHFFLGCLIFFNKHINKQNQNNLKDVTTQKIHTQDLNYLLTSSFKSHSLQNHLEAITYRTLFMSDSWVSKDWIHCPERMSHTLAFLSQPCNKIQTCRLRGNIKNNSLMSNKL